MVEWCCNKRVGYKYHQLQLSEPEHTSESVNQNRNKSEKVSQSIAAFTVAAAGIWPGRGAFGQ